MMKISSLNLNRQIISYLIAALFLGLTGCSFNEPPPGQATAIIATPLPTFTAVAELPSPTTPATATLPPTSEPPPATATPTTIVQQGDTLPLPSPSPDPAQGLACLVQINMVNLREGPDPTYQIIATLGSGSSILALKRAEEGAWLLGETSQQVVGWVSQDSVTCQGDLAALPVAVGVAAQSASLPATPLPPPPPTATPLPPVPTETPVPPTPASPPLGRWRGEYYDNASLLGEPVLVREDATLDFNWFLDSPAPGIPADNFSVRWTGVFDFPQAGDYRFFASVDDGVRLYLDGWLVIDAWQLFVPIDYFGVFEDVQPGLHTITVEYFESGGHAKAKVWNEFGDFSSEEWIGEYFNNDGFAGPPVFTENTEEIDFDWEDGSPRGQLKDSGFSVRWRRNTHFEAGDYDFFAKVADEDEVRFTLDGWEVLNARRGEAGEVEGAFNELGAGNHTLVVEYRDLGDEASIEFGWDRHD